MSKHICVHLILNKSFHMFEKKTQNKTKHEARMADCPVSLHYVNIYIIISILNSHS